MTHTIAIGSDHAGLALKSHLIAFLKEKGHQVADVGTHDIDSVDYPDFAKTVATSVLSQTADYGIIICGTGLGVSMTANRFAGIRCGLCHDLTTARMARQHNNANMLALGARLIAAPLAEEIATMFLDTAFEGGRHEKRVLKIDQITAEG